MRRDRGYLALLAVILSGTVSAQDAEEAPAVEVIGARDAPGAALEAPALTGSRLGVSVEQLPASVEIVDRATLEARAERSIGEALENVTGLTYGNPPADPSIYCLRGFCANAITNLYDGIRIGPATMTSRPADTFNLDRIEVLKGPASTLYGEGAVGGAVNFVPKRPERGPFTAEGLLSYGRFDAWRIGAGAGGPAGESVHYRFDISEQRADGFVDRTEHRYLTFTGGVLWDVNPDVSLEFDLDYGQDDHSAYWGTPLVTQALSGAQPLAGLLADSQGRFVDARLRDKNYNVADNDVSSESWWARVKLQAALGRGWQLRNELYRFEADRNWRNAEVYAFNAGTGRIDRDRFSVSHDQEVMGNRLELLGTGSMLGRQNRFLAGLDLSRLDFYRPSSFEGGDSVDPFDPEPGSYGILVNAVRTTRLDTLAVFMEDQLTLAPSLTAMAGFRAERIHLVREDFNTDGSRRTDGIDRQFSPLSARLGVTWEAHPRLNLYAQYGTSADVASNTSNIFLLRAAQNFDLAKGRQWEVGMKHRFWQSRGFVTLAWYDIERRNLLSRTAADTVSNIGRQSADGLEVAAGAKLSASWRVSVNFAHTRARYDFYRDTGSGDVFDGNSPPNVPRNVASAEVLWRVGASPMEISVSGRHVGDRAGNDSNSLRLLGYTTYDASVSWTLGPARLSFLVRNLTDEDYVAWADVFYPTQVLLGAPRTYELRLAARF